MFFYFFFHFSWTTKLLCDTLILALRHPLLCPMALGFLGRVPLQNPLGVVCTSNASIFNQFRTLCTQWANRNPFAINRFRTLFHVMGRRGTLGSALCCLPLHSSCKFAALFSISCKMPLQQLFSFHTFALLPGGGWGVGTAQVKVLLELEQRRPAAP